MKDINHDWEQYQFELDCELRRQGVELTKTEIAKLKDEIKQRVRSQGSHSNLIKSKPITYLKHSRARSKIRMKIKKKDILANQTTASLYSTLFLLLAPRTPLLRPPFKLAPNRFSSPIDCLYSHL